jgi:hypothetical protein
MFLKSYFKESLALSLRTVKLERGRRTPCWAAMNTQIIVGEIMTLKVLMLHDIAMA